MFIHERFSQLDDEAKARIAKLEKEVAVLKCHQDEAQGRAPIKTFLLCV